MKAPLRIVSIGVWALAVATMLGFTGCDSGSPTEPQGASGVNVTLTTNPTGAPGVYTFVTDVCDCATTSVALIVDRYATAKMACTDSTLVTLASGRHTISFEWPDQRPVVSFSFDSTDTSSGTITATCEYR
ncbi:MAG: hypothetical protein HY825_15930 [Acidobacteria bacterium]|nr:hypothetical protein [Acidobacteriota bacterium]